MSVQRLCERNARSCSGAGKVGAMRICALNLRRADGGVTSRASVASELSADRQVEICSRSEGPGVAVGPSSRWPTRTRLSPM